MGPLSGSHCVSGPIAEVQQRVISAKQLRELVIVPTLRSLARAEPRLDSPAAVELLLGTALHESTSRTTTYLRQIPNGPARGLWQMEPATHEWLRRRMGRTSRELLAAVDELRGSYPPPLDALYGALYYACAMARIRYWVVPAALPAADDVEGMADYWKAHYNTPAGAGRPEQWVSTYRGLA